MSEVKKYDPLFITALLLASWFLITGMAWSYYAALFISYPAGTASLVLWFIGKRIDSKKRRYQIIVVILGIGLTLSLGLLALLLLFG